LRVDGVGLGKGQVGGKETVQKKRYGVAIM